MATKRKFPADNADNSDIYNDSKKHTLDSDEEDSDDYERDHLNDSDIEGGEDGVAQVEDEVKITPFNMHEELQEGHFDKEGHYHWNKNSDIRDNWLDNIDWVKVETDKNYFNPEEDENSTNGGNAADIYNSSMAYAKILEFMEPKETIQITLQRLGKNRPKLSSVERLRRKKAGIEDKETVKIAKLTELANEILSKTGNMDIYQETYEQIKSRLSNLPSTSKSAAEEESFDMYADDFADKEKERLQSAKNEPKDKPQNDSASNEVKWEFKWKQDDSQVHGPYSTAKMSKWADEKYFKEGVYVRKLGDSNFYTSNRIDFDLYL